MSDDPKAEVVTSAGPIVRAPTRALATPDPTPAHLLQTAIEHGASIEQLRALVGLKREWDAHEARKSYAAAMAAWKQRAPRIVKDALVDFGRGDKRTTYRHATLGNVVNAVTDSLAEHGFSISWHTAQPSHDWVDVTCRVTHQAGHAEELTLGAPIDRSGNKNPIQQIASTKTYLERHTLKAALGLAEHDPSADYGDTGGDDPPRMPLAMTDAQRDRLCSLAHDARLTERTRAQIRARLKRLVVGRDECGAAAGKLIGWAKARAAGSVAAYDATKDEASAPHSAIDGAVCEVCGADVQGDER